MENDPFVRSSNFLAQTFNQRKLQEIRTKIKTNTDLYMCIYIYVCVFMYTYVCIYICLYIAFQLRVKSGPHAFSQSLIINHQGGAKLHNLQ